MIISEIFLFVSYSLLITISQSCEGRIEKLILINKFDNMNSTNMIKEELLNTNVKLAIENHRLKKILKKKQKEKNQFLIDIINLKLKFIQNNI